MSRLSDPGRRALFPASRLKPADLPALELRSSESPRPKPPRPPEAPQVVQAFISRHRPFFTLAGVLVLQAVLLSFEIAHQHQVPRAKVWAVTAMAPFERSLRGLADVTGGSWEALRDLAQAEQQNRALSARLAADETELRRLSEQGAANERLRALLEFRSRAPFSTVAAEVIGSSPGENSSAVLIDKGADSGFTADLPVVTPDGVAGKIIAVYPHSAQVLLITDPASGAGSLLEKSRTQGVLKGSDRGLCRLDYIMNEEAVSPGDRVVTSGLDQIFPKGLPLGIVVKTGEGNVYKDILVKPAAGLDRLEEVLVVVSKPATPEEARRRN